MTAYAYIEPQPPYEGIFYCPGCVLDREFETDVEYEGREMANKPLYCTACARRIDVKVTRIEVYPDPPILVEEAAMTIEQRQAGKARLLQKRLEGIPPDDEEMVELVGSDEADLRAQIAMLENRRRP